MFEKCGFRDVMARIWRYKIFILIVTALFVILGIGISAMKSSGQSTLEREGNWIATASYLTEDQAATAEGDRSIQFAATVAGVLGSDYARYQINEILLQAFTKEDIIKYAGLSVPADEYSSSSLTDLYEVKTTSNTPIFTITIKAKDEQFVNAALKACTATLEQSVQSLSEASIKLIGETTEQTMETVSAAYTPKKMIIAAFGILGLGLSLLVTLFMAMFFPTVNRKEDFALYGVPVLGELPIAKGGENHG
ncbi:hypothetical protein DPQ25_03770 [Hydrogeniiclostridium mannosilyticum]|uniref:Polysaccharide chain length determinant N-terminal domain-containing protein n=1 Tax=Hydrogeniiclostridium mannosilyticum TaxID=2764322 RepID=A0A328UNX2_9FIRM|nr:hypothetical protein DPQ25_03770 [Hydrogeniiclostridium mannosilyticum]